MKRSTRSGETGSGPFRGPFSDEEYATQLERKRSRVQALFEGTELEVFAGEWRHHRYRATVAVSRVLPRQLGFWRCAEPEGYHEPVGETRVVFAEPIVRALDALEPVDAHEWLGDVRAVQLHATFSGELIVCFCFPAPVEADTFLEPARAWGKSVGAQVMARWRRGQLVCGENFVTERFPVLGRTVLLRQPEGAFSNPNAAIEAETLPHLASLLERAPPPRRLLELFCGGGTNLLALAPLCERAVGVEIDGRLVEVGRVNIGLNQLEGRAEIVQMDAGCFSARCQEDCNVLLLDPPRQGLDPASLQLASGFGYVLYISCNPDRLRVDATELAKTHALESLTLFDHFPFTEHSECVALFRRRVEPAVAG